MERSERPDDAVAAAINVYVDEMGLYDRSDDSYIMVDSNEEPDLAYSTICDLHNVDVELLGKAVAERQYVPEFFVKTKCPHCGREATDPLDIDALLFLLARAFVHGDIVMKQYMEFIDDILYEFDGQIGVSDIMRMTYKELGYLREHRKKAHPRDADLVAKALLSK